MAAQPTLRRTAPWRVLDGFGRAQLAASRYVRPCSVDDMAAVFQRAAEEGLRVTLRGSGRSYGDASLITGGLAVDNRGLDRMLAWDPHHGVADLEAGVTIEGLWRRTLQDGWWPTVVPGTMHPTLGGCAAMNIHGKNCFRVGPFGDSVLELDLLTADGELRTLSRTREPERFHAVIAGLGLLGAVTRLRVQLKRVESGRLHVVPLVSRGLGEMFEQFDTHLPDADYLVGWVDCFAGGRALGRGLVHRADYVHGDPNAFDTLKVERQVIPGHILGLPRSQVWRLMRLFMHDDGMRFVNAVKYRMPEDPFHAASDGSYTQSHVAFAFLLDYVPDWRLAYGREGFLQYQVFLPEPAARTVMPELLETCRRHDIVSYLGVFKRHRVDAFLLSHGLDGWSLALDFPVRRHRAREQQALFGELTARVLDAGGTFYAAKDSVLDADAFARAYGDRLTRFAAMKRELDPHGLFGGDQAKRLMPGLLASA